MKEFWITNSRFRFIAVLLLIIFLVFMLVIYVKADEVTRDPCSICAERMGEDVVCSISSGGFLIQKTFFVNGSGNEEE